MENLILKQGITGQLCCSSRLGGEGRLAMGSPDPPTTLRWCERGQGGEDSMVHDVNRDQSPSQVDFVRSSERQGDVIDNTSMSTASTRVTLWVDFHFFVVKEVTVGQSRSITISPWLR